MRHPPVLCSNPSEDGLVSIMGPYIWGYDDETPQQAVGDLLVAKGLSLSTMEHCTGGVLASSISETAGTAEYYHRGLVVYGRESAVDSGVSAEIIDAHGLVSPETAQAMARAAAGTSESGADVGIGITGVLGPDEVDHQPPRCHPHSPGPPSCVGRVGDPHSLAFAAQAIGNQTQGLFYGAHRTAPHPQYALAGPGRQRGLPKQVRLPHTSLSNGWLTPAIPYTLGPYGKRERRRKRQDEGPANNGRHRGQPIPR